MDGQEQTYSCPRCGSAIDKSSIYLGKDGEGHICGDCWVQDRYEDWIKGHAYSESIEPSDKR